MICCDADSLKLITNVGVMAKAYVGLNCEPKEPLTIDVEVDVMPEVTWRSPYKGLRVVLPAAPVDAAAAAAAAAEAELAKKHTALGDMRVVVGRGLQAGDIARCDMSARRLNADGSEGDLELSFQLKSHFLDTASAEAKSLAGLVDGMVGMVVSDKRNVDITFPADWSVESLRGTRGRVLVALMELFDRTLPPLDDALAPQLFAGATTLAAARAGLLAEAQAEAEAASKEARVKALRAALNAAVDVELPDSLVQEQGREMYTQRLLDLQSSGRLAPSAMGTMMTPGLVNEYMKKNEADIAERIRTQFAVNAVIAAEKIGVPAADVAALVAKRKKELEAWKTEADEARLQQAAEEELGTQAAWDWLLKHAKVETA